MGGKGTQFAFICLISLLSLAFSEDIVFFESFTKDFKDRWIVSENEDYQGVWKHSPGEGHGDNGLLVSEKAKKYAIATSLPAPVDPKVGPLVLQYDLRFQNGLTCGGAYLKFLMPQESGWSPSKFKDDTPYSIMFGPDKCGGTNKIHFIFRHKNPITGKYVEHHLKNPPPPISDKLTHVYTAVIYPNNTVKILVDGVEKKVKDMLSLDFDPPVLPPKTIPDPDDKKPEDWDERVKIPDPEATKPEDWDEDAPAEIVDEDAVKPSDWLDEEPLQIDDPDAEKPSDWDEEEDGEWEPPKVSNPKCEEASGCGEWKKPMIKNPNFKGKWNAPMIDNPAYKGKWAPREIPNPGFFGLERPNLEPVAAVGIEIWTMDSGIVFDNILVTDNEEVAEEYRRTKWLPKKDTEEEMEKLKKKKDEEKFNKEKPKKEGFEGVVFNGIHEIAEKLSSSKLFSPYKSQIQDIVKKAEDHPQITYVVLALLFILTVSFVYFLIPGGKKTKKMKASSGRAKKEDVSSPDDSVVTEGKENKEEEKEDSEIKEEKKSESQSESESETKVRRRSRRDI